MNTLFAGLIVTGAALSGGVLLIHTGFRPRRCPGRVTPADLGLSYRDIRIPIRQGKTLHAWWLPAAGPAPTVVILHGWGANAGMMLPFAVPFSRGGLNVLLPEARNHGQSDSAGFSSLPRFAEDAGAAVDWVRRGDGGMQPVVLLGHSVGAGAVLFEASRRTDIAAVISVAAFAHPAAMMRRYLGCRGIPSVLATPVSRYVQWVIGHDFDAIAPLNTIRRIDVPVLLVHGRADETVPVSDAREIRARGAGRQVELLEIDGAGHASAGAVAVHADRLIDFVCRAGIPRPGRDPECGSGL